MNLALESLPNCFEEAMGLWEQHWVETEAAYRSAPLNPDLEQFRRMDECGWSRYFTARVDGRLVGHLYFIVYPSRHTRTTTAVEDFFFLAPEARLGFAALKMLRFAMDSLRTEGVESIGITSKLTGKRPIDALLKRVGFRHVANFYST